MAKNVIIGTKLSTGYLEMIFCLAEFCYDFNWLHFIKVWHKYCNGVFIYTIFRREIKKMRSFVIGLILIFGILIALGYAYGG